MKTTRREFETALTSEQRALRDEIIVKVRKILSLQHDNRVSDAQKAYEYLHGWCDGKGVDFSNAYGGAVKFLQTTAVGLKDSASSRGM